MALQVTTLGGSAAQSGTAASGRIEECTGCGFVATTVYQGKDGKPYAVCLDCKGRLDEQQEYGWEDDELQCADCGTTLGPSRAPCRFLHLSKGAFWLCSDCWCNADHEEDYLEHCNCNETVYWKPEDEPMSCYWCCRPVKHVQHCGCPVPSVDKETPDHCLFCKGAVERKKDE
jgi:hypothetical protein